MERQLLRNFSKILAFKRDVFQVRRIVWGISIFFVTTGESMPVRISYVLKMKCGGELDHLQN